MSHYPDLSLTGRHALVCGASAGIGRATALTLAAMGAEITALARRADRLDALVTEITAAGGRARALVADMDDRGALSDHIDALLGAHGPVHVLINNTGGPPGGPLLEATEAAFLNALGRHLFVGHLLVRKCLPGMRASGFGRVVNILSTSVREPIPNLGVSNITRSAVAAWAKTLSRELPPGVTINNVLPGFTDTERLDALRAGNAARTATSEDQVQSGWMDQVPEGRLGTPAELAAAVALLVSPAGGFLRGVSLPVDGGRLRGI